MKVKIVGLLLWLLLSACGGGGGSNSAPPPEVKNTWDTMNWDSGQWA